MTQGQWIEKNINFIKEGIRAGIFSYLLVTHYEIWKEFHMMKGSKIMRYEILAEKYGYNSTSNIKYIVKKLDQPIFGQKRLPT